MRARLFIPLCAMLGLTALACDNDDDDPGPDDGGIGEALGDCLDACSEDLDSCEAECEDGDCEAECMSDFDSCEEQCGG